MGLTLKDIRAGINSGRKLMYKSKGVGDNMKPTIYAVESLDFSKSSDAIVVITVIPNTDGKRVTSIDNLYFKQPS